MKEGSPELTVIMPVHNERQTVLDILERVRAVGLDKEIIVVDDGSTDGTAEILEEAAAERPEVVLLFHERNLGEDEEGPGA